MSRQAWGEKVAVGVYKLDDGYRIELRVPMGGKVIARERKLTGVSQDQAVAFRQQLIEEVAGNGNKKIVMPARKPDSARLPKNGRFFRGLLVGGPGDIYRDIQPRMLEDFGIDLEQHWRSEAGMKRVVKETLPSGCEVVIILTDMVGHANGQLVVKLAKTAGISYALTGRKRSAWVTGLLAMGFEQKPGWLKPVVAVFPAPKLETVTAEQIEEMTVAVAPATLTPSPASVPLATTREVEHVQRHTELQRDARIDVVRVIAVGNATSMPSLGNSLNKYTVRELRVAVANLIAEKWLFERPDKRIDLMPDKKTIFLNTPNNKVVGRPLDGRLDAVPLKQTVLSDALKIGNTDIVFDLAQQRGVCVRLGHGYSKDHKLTLDGLEATIASADGVLHRFELSWRAVYGITNNGTVARTWPECGKIPDDARVVPMNAPLPAAAVVAPAPVATPVVIYEPPKVVAPAPAPAPPVAKPPGFMTGTLREVQEPSTEFLKKALPDAIYRHLVERGEQTVSRLGNITKYKAANIRWALAKLVEAGRVKEAAGSNFEAVLPRSGKDMPKRVDLPPPEADDAVATPTIPIYANPDAFADDAAFRDFTVKYIGAMVENTINMRERLIRMGKRQRLMERILAKIFTDLGGSVEGISELMVDDEEPNS
jgi:hypothetical protein